MALTPLPDNGTMTSTAVFPGADPDWLPSTVDDDMERLLEKERELEEFYSTYDVWTGIRTAVTLALFFVFSVTIILYKSKCKPRRKYELYPSLEDMPGRPLDYYDYWCSSPGSHEAGKTGSGVDSLGICYNRGETGSAPLPTQRSVDSYSSLNNSFRVKSLPGSVMRINCSRNSSFERDDASQAHSVRSEFLSVPGVRLQSTGSSSDGYSMASSVHDLSGEMTPMALLGVPRLGPRGNKPLLQLGGMDWDSDHATAEWIQTIDINVIQPTPNISPCGSVRSVTDNTDLARLPLPGRGRIASVVSLDSPEFDNRSIGSDSVFMEDSVGETYSSRSESMDSPSPSLLASPRPSLTPSPRSGRHKIQSFRLGINPSVMPVAPSSPVPTRALKSEEPSPRPNDKRSRQKQLHRQLGQELSLSSLAPNAAAMSSLAVPTLGGHLRSSCEHLAAHSGLIDGSNYSNSRGSSLLAPNGSTEEEPQCAVFTVPSLRRCNSATAPDQNEEPSGWKRSDSAQTPVVRRSDSAGGPQKQSSESSSGSDDASESVSFHLMVPALSIDNPSNDTSRASTPSLSPPSSPNSSPSPVFCSPTPQPLHVLEPPVSPSPSPSPTGFRGHATRSNGRSNGRANGRRVLRRQYSQCIPPSPTLLDVPATHTSLPTYVEEIFPELDYSFPAAPPPSPFRAGHTLYMRQDSGSPSPRLAARHLNRRDSSPTLLRPDGYQLLRQESTPTPTSPHRKTAGLQREDSSPSPNHRRAASLLRDDSTPPNHRRAAGLQREDSTPSPSQHRTASLQREDSSPTSTSCRTPSLHREDSSPTFPYRMDYFHREDSSASSQTRSASLQREDSSTTSSFSRTSTLQNEESSLDHTLHTLPRQDSSPPPPFPTEETQEGQQTPSTASSVMETSC